MTTTTDTVNDQLRPRRPAPVRSWELDRGLHRRSALVAGCDDCLELVAEDLKGHNNYCAIASTAGRRSPPAAVVLIQKKLHP